MRLFVTVLFVVAACIQISKAVEFARFDVLRPKSNVAVSVAVISRKTATGYKLRSCESLFRTSDQLCSDAVNCCQLSGR